MPFQDKYVLTPSSAQVLPSGGREIQFDLTLEPNPAIDTATVFGTVKGELQQPIPGACVKVTDPLGAPLAHATTDSNGQYSVQVPPGQPQYRVFATARGYFSSPAQLIALSPRQAVEVNFGLVLDPNAGNGLIAGHVLTVQATPIPDAVVNLFRVVDTTAQFEQTSRSNTQGQFVFSDLVQGSYRIQASAVGFQTQTLNVLIDQPKQLVRVMIMLELDKKGNLGTVNGTIKDTAGVPIVDAVVVLFSIQDTGLFPVAFTKTNREGLYLFCDVEPGNYLVKSTLKEQIPASA